MAKRIYLVLLLCSSLLFHTANAQLFTGRTSDTPDLKSDTSKNKKQLKTNDSIQIYYVDAKQNNPKILDTSIVLQHRNPFLSIWDRDLGNTGTAYQSLLFQADMHANMKLGMQHNLGYSIQRDSLRYYNTTRPYSDIYYWMGRKQEQCIQLFHTQNIQERWNVSALYRKLVSPGNYKFLRSNQDVAYVNSWYQSNKQRYENKASFIYNKLQQDESGGLTSEEQLMDPSFRDRRLLPVLYEASDYSVNRSSVINSFRDASFNVTHQYFFGKNRTDSLGHVTFLPTFGLKHRLYSDFIYQYYEDQEPDSSEYGYIYTRDQANADSLYHKHFLIQIGNSFSLNQNVRLKGKAVTIEAGYGVEYEQQITKQGKVDFLNNYVFGLIQKEQQDGDRWKYEASLRYYLTGNAQNNLLLHGVLGRRISERIGQVDLLFNQSIQSPDYKQAYYYYNHEADQLALLKIAINQIGFRYQLTARHLAITLQQYTVLNMLYADTNLGIQQYAQVIPISQGLVSKSFHWRQYVMDNELFVQHAPATSPVHVPVFATCNRLYLNRKVLKEKLLIVTGVEMRYNSPFKTDQYIPVFQSFAPQYRRTIANIPAFTYFFNFKIKRFRASISIDEIQQLYAVNNLNYNAYPTPNLMFRFKLNWVFIN